VPSGFVDLDTLTSGFQKSDFVVVAARPSMGKTAFTLNVAEHVAVDHRLPVAFFSLEMSKEALVQRLLSSLSRVDGNRLRTGFLRENEWPRLTTAAGRLSEAELWIDDTAGITALEIRAKARRLMVETKGRLAMVVIDYLQLIRGHGRQENRQQEISHISRSLKALAKELKVPVVALSQLKRPTDVKEGGRRPVLSDLRECVTGDTLAVLTDGRRVPVRDLVGTTPRVVAVDTSGRLTSAVSDRVWSVGVRPVFRIELDGGRSIRATGEHRLLALDGWRTVTRLAPGDRLAVSAPSAVPVSTRSRAGTCALLDAPDVVPVSTGDLRWPRITSIEPAGEEEVFDLTVPGPSCWLADGIVSHNSGAIEQDADVVLFIHRPEVYGVQEKEGIAELILGKQRNGPIGLVEVAFQKSITRFENLARVRE